jgi:hypothetical protein
VGVSDFLAGLVARRLPVLTLLILSQAAGLLMLLALLGRDRRSGATAAGRVGTLTTAPGGAP